MYVENGPVRLSAIVMGHPARIPAIRALCAMLGVPAEVDYGATGNWATARRSWLRFDRDATHHMVLQDDVIPCADFMAQAARAVAHAPPGITPVSLFNYHPSLNDRAKAAGVHWAVRPIVSGAQALVLPVAAVHEMALWIERHCAPGKATDDLRISAWLMHKGILAWHTAPSLVQHNDGLPSLLGNPHLLPSPGGQMRRRISHWAPQDVSAVDWTQGLVNPVKVAGYSISPDDKLWKQPRPVAR